MQGIYGSHTPGRTISFTTVLYVAYYSYTTYCILTTTAVKILEISQEVVNDLSVWCDEQHSLVRYITSSSSFPNYLRSFLSPLAPLL